MSRPFLQNTLGRIPDRCRQVPPASYKFVFFDQNEVGWILPRIVEGTSFLVFNLCLVFIEIPKLCEEVHQGLRRPNFLKAALGIILDRRWLMEVHENTFLVVVLAIRHQGRAFIHECFIKCFLAWIQFVGHVGRCYCPGRVIESRVSRRGKRW